MHRREGDGKDIHWSAQNAALFVDLIWNISWQNTEHNQDENIYCRNHESANTIHKE